MNLRSTRARLALVGLTAGVLAGLGTQVASAGLPGLTEGDSKARSLLEQELRIPASIDRGPAVFDDLTDLLSNVTYTDRRGDRSLTDLVVRGNVVDVQPVAGFVPSRSVEEPLHGEAASFFAKDAMWRTVNLRIKVESVVGNSGRDVPEMLDVAFALRQPQTTIEDVRAGFASFESAVFFLYRQDPAPRGIKKDAYSIVMDGAMIAEVVGDRLSLPAFRGLEPWEGTGLTEEQLIARARSYSELSERANEPESARERAVGDQFRPRS